MEIPEYIKGLYRHWEVHTSSHQVAISGIPQGMRWFINERIKVWERKALREQPPYTKDSILARYRFCNIFREFDRQTIEIHSLLNPLRGDFPLWLMNMFYARMVARPETLHTVGLLSFNPTANQSLYKRLIDLPRPRFGTPYVFPVSAIQKSDTPTRELFLANYVPTAIRRISDEIQQWNSMSVYDGIERVISYFEFNLTFLWTEVLIDVAYQFPERINLFKRFPIGPGSLPTFKTLCSAIDPSLYVEGLAAASMTTDVTYDHKPLKLSAENWEGIGCEYRKYMNLKQGRGRKRIYKPSASLRQF